MHITATCDCGKSYQVKQELAGKRAKCPACGGAFQIPIIPPKTAADPLALGDFDASSSFGIPSIPTASASTPNAAHSYGSKTPTPKKVARKVPIVLISVAASVGLLLLVSIPAVLLLRTGRGTDESAAATGNGSSDTSSATAVAQTIDMIEIDDTQAWQWKRETLPAAPSNLLPQPIRFAGNPAAVQFLHPSKSEVISSCQRYSQEADLIIERWDLKTSNRVSEISMTQQTQYLGASPDGAAFAVHPASPGVDKETIEVWQWKGKTAERVTTWKPYANESAKGVQWALMLSPKRIVTQRLQDKFAIVWDTESKKALYGIPKPSYKEMFLSPGGAYLVGHSGVWLRFFDAASGKHSGSIGPLSDDYIMTGLSFSRDGNSIAALFFQSGGQDMIHIWDLATRSLLHQIPNGNGRSHLQWCGNDYLLSFGRLISLRHEMEVWNYLGGGKLVQSVDSRGWFQISAGGEYYLAAIDLPSAAVSSHIENFVAANVPVLQKGDRISLQASAKALSPREDLQDTLVREFAGKLRATGYEVSEGQPYTLVVAVEEKETGKQLEYHSGLETFKVPNRPIVCQLKIIDMEGTEIWSKRESVGTAFMTFGTEEDRVQRILDSRWTNVDKWIAKQKVPEVFRRLSSTGQFGNSLVKLDGEQITKVPAP